MESSSELPQTLVVRNGSAEPLEIMVEVNPDRYELQPGDKIEIEAVLNGVPLEISAYEGGCKSI